MTTLTASHLATLPRVNLLPPEIEEQRKFKRLQVGLAAGLLGVVGVVGALTVMANGAVGDAESDLEAEQARASQLQAQEAKYAEVPLVYAQVEAATAQLGQAMGKEVRWSQFLNDMSLRVPDKVWLTSMTVTQNVEAVAAVAPVATDPYAVTGLGTVSFVGKGLSHNSVAAWLDALAKQNGLTQPYFTSSTKELIGSQRVVNFVSQATVTEAALSKRYTPEAGS